ncbi:MAG: hypothetical protein M0Z55_05235 [Peptococcaceae bacterium]|nr:hypothetical protein [Peptococcaceae bacterium]
MGNPCGTTRANVVAKTEVKGIPIYWGTGVNPVNSPAQFFVAWGNRVLTGGVIHTFNSDAKQEGFLWFVDEDEAEAKYKSLLLQLAQ